MYVLGDPLQSYHLRQTFPAELCVMSLIQNEFSEALQYLKNGLDVFLSEWQLLNPIFGNLRYATSFSVTVKHIINADCLQMHSCCFD